VVRHAEIIEVIRNLCWIFFFVASFIGIVITVFTYWKNALRSRAEWLHKLYETFYSGDRYKEIRKRIEYNDRELWTILKGNHRENDSKLQIIEEKFTDYLNYFEFLCYLREIKQLNEKDIKAMYDYYLRKLKEKNLVFNYIRKYGYEKLEKFLKENYE